MIETLNTRMLGLKPRAAARRRTPSPALEKVPSQGAGVELRGLPRTSASAVEQALEGLGGGRRQRLAQASVSRIGRAPDRPGFGTHLAPGGYAMIFDTAGCVVQLLGGAGDGAMPGPHAGWHVAASTPA